MPRDEEVGLIAEYRYLAKSLASQHGCLHRNFQGDGHLFIFESADAAMQFSLKLIERWGSGQSWSTGLGHSPGLPLHLGCHFGDATHLDDGDAWIGRSIDLARRIARAAEAGSLLFTENVLDASDVAMYEFQPAGLHALEGDHLPQRTLYRIIPSPQKAPGSVGERDTSETLFLAGVTYIGTAQENGEEETGCYVRALAMRPDYAEAHNNLGVVMRAKGEEGLAASTTARRSRFALGIPKPTIAMGCSYICAVISMAPPTATRRLCYCARITWTPITGWVICCVWWGEAGQSENHYAEALRLRPEYAEVHNNLAILLDDLGQTERAQHHYKEALRIRPGYPEAHYNFALALENVGRQEGAEASYLEALRQTLEYPEAHNNLAILLQILGDLTAAEMHYLDVLRLRSGDPETHYNLSLLLRVQGRDSEADEHLIIARELAPAEWFSAQQPSEENSGEAPGRWTASHRGRLRS